jgi:hypothetical protein
MSPAAAEHRFKPGDQWTGNRQGAAIVPKDKRAIYREVRRLALDRSPRAMARLVELMESADERVAIIATNSILDRAGIRAIDKPEDLDGDRPQTDVSRLSRAERDELERLLRKAMVQQPDSLASDAQGQPIESEVIPPESADER